MKTFKRECKSSLSLMLVVMLVMSMMMGVFTLSASADSNDLPAVVNSPVCAYVPKAPLASAYQSYSYCWGQLSNICISLDDSSSDLKISDIVDVDIDYYDGLYSQRYTKSNNWYNNNYWSVSSDFGALFLFGIDNYWVPYGSTSDYGNDLYDSMRYANGYDSFGYDQYFASLERSYIVVTIHYGDGSTQPVIVKPEENKYTDYYLWNTSNSALLQFAHSTNINNESFYELDNAIAFGNLVNENTTKRFYVDIDNEEDIVLPMDNMSTVLRLEQTRVGDNVVYNSGNTVDFGEYAVGYPTNGVSDGKADKWRVVTVQYNGRLYSITPESLYNYSYTSGDYDYYSYFYDCIYNAGFRVVELDGKYYIYNGIPTVNGNEGWYNLVDRGNLVTGGMYSGIPNTDFDEAAVQNNTSGKSYPSEFYIKLSGIVDEDDVVDFLTAFRTYCQASDTPDSVKAIYNSSNFKANASFTYECDYRYLYKQTGSWSYGYNYYFRKDHQSPTNVSSVLFRVNDAVSKPEYSDSSLGGRYYHTSTYGGRGVFKGLSLNDFLDNYANSTEYSYRYFSTSSEDRKTTSSDYNYNYNYDTNEGYLYQYSNLNNLQYLSYTAANSLATQDEIDGWRLIGEFIENWKNGSIVPNESYMPSYDNITLTPFKSYFDVVDTYQLPGSYDSNFGKNSQKGAYISNVTISDAEIIRDTFTGDSIVFNRTDLDNIQKGVSYNVVNQVINLGEYLHNYAKYSNGEFVRYSDNHKNDYYDDYLKRIEYKWGEIIFASRPDPVVDLAYDHNTKKLTWTKPVDEGFGVETDDTPNHEPATKIDPEDIVYVMTYTITVVDEDGNETYRTIITRDKSSDDVVLDIPDSAVGDPDKTHKLVVLCTNVIGDSDEREVTYYLPPEKVPSVEITMTPDKPLYRDDETVIYTETVKNTGSVTLTDVTVNQELPGEYVPQDGLTPKGTVAKIPDLKPGESYTFYYKVPASIAVDDTIINNADVTTAQNVTDDDTCTVHTYRLESPDIPKTPTYDIQVTTTPDKRVYNDLENIYYTDVVTNTGDTTLTDVVVKEDFTKGGYLDPEVGTLNKNGTVTIDKLEPGESVTLTYKINVQDAPVADDKTVTNKVTATAAEGVSDDDSSIVEIIHYSIKVTKEADKRNHIMGDNVVFTNVVTNNGDTKLTNIVVTEDLSGTFALTNGAIIMNDHIVIAELNPGESYTYKYVVPANDKNVVDGKITSVVTAVASEDSIAESSDKVSDTDTDYALVNAPEIEVTKTVDGRTYKIGETVVWTDTITNKGDMPLTNVVVTENINGTFEDVEYDTTENSFVIPKLDVGESYTFKFSTVVTNENVTDDMHSTTVKAVAAEGVSDEDTKEVPVNAAAIKVVKTVTKYEYTPDDTIIYTDIITNTGSVILTHVVVTENLPGQFTMYDPKYTADGNTLIIDKMERGQTIVVKYEVKVSDVDYSEDDPTITCTVTAEAKEGVKDDDSVDVTVIIPEPEPETPPTDNNEVPPTDIDDHTDSVEIKDSTVEKEPESVEPPQSTDTGTVEPPKDSEPETVEPPQSTDTGTVEPPKDSEPTREDTDETDTSTEVPPTTTDTNTNEDGTVETPQDTDPGTVETPQDTDPGTVEIPQDTDTGTVDPPKPPETDSDDTEVPDTTTEEPDTTPVETTTDSVIPTDTTPDTNTGKELGGNVDKEKKSDSDKQETNTNTNTNTTNTPVTATYSPTPPPSGGGTAEPVKTGDTRNVAGFAMVMLTAMAAVAFTFRKREED